MGQTQFRSDDTVKWWLGFGDGSDGDYSSSGNATDAPVDSACSGTSGTTSLTATNVSFTNGKPILIIQCYGTGAGNWELNQIASYSAGTITTASALKNSYITGAQVIQLKQYASFLQNSGHTLTVKAWNGTVGGIIAFLCKGTVTITGSLSLIGAAGGVETTTSGGGMRGGAGVRNSGTSGVSYCGDGSNQLTQKDNNTSGSGGGSCIGDDFPGSGGGNGAAGTQGTNPGRTGSLGVAGIAVGNASLTSMFMGGGGSGASRYGASNGGSGGSGGGICLIICKDITIGGTVVLTGGAGNNTQKGTGGGGAGGSCLIKAKTATLGTTKITASGGLGGTYDLQAGNGGVGRIHLDYSESYSGSTTPAIDVTQDLTIVDVGGSKPLFFAQY